MTLVDSEEWTLKAKCRGLADALFPEGKDQKRARAVCMGCAVRSHCLAEALDHRIEWGVWGGLTERERRQLLRQRPDIKDWAAVLLAPVEDPTPVRMVDAGLLEMVVRGSAAAPAEPTHSRTHVPVDQTSH